MTNRIFIIILLLTVNQFSGGTAQAAVLLKAVNRTDDSGHMQLSLHFDQLPTYTTTTSGRRVDLECQNTILTDTLPLPATDEKMIKVVSNQKKTKVLLSFYFRYPPQKVTPKSNKDTAIVILDIFLGNRPTTPTEIPAKLQGVDAANQAKDDSPNPVTVSIYAKNWISLFTEYESQVEIAVAPKLSLPPFPLAAAIQPNIANEIWLPAEIEPLAKENKWAQVCQLLYKPVSYTHLRAHETDSYLVCRLL